MKRLIAGFALLALCACTPPAGDAGPQSVVAEIYGAAQQHVGTSTTPIEAIPMTEELGALITRARAAAQSRNEPFIDGDLALNCQDCVSLSDVVIAPQTGPEAEPAAEGHVWIEARFRINGNEDRAVLYDMVETANGWRVDNILAEGFDLRAEAEAYLAESEPAATAIIPAEETPPTP